jgi:hypothetical protein
MTDISSQNGVSIHNQKATMKCGNLEEGIQSPFVKQILGGQGIVEDMVF